MITTDTVEQLQENLRSYLDWLPDELLDNICQIVIDTIKGTPND